MAKVMHSPGVAASSTRRKVTGWMTGGGGADQGLNHCGVPGAGKFAGGPDGPPSGPDGGGGGVQVVAGGGDQVGVGAGGGPGRGAGVGPAGGLQWAALQAESVAVIVLVTTSKGAAGSRPAPWLGTRAASSTTGAAGSLNLGRSGGAVGIGSVLGAGSSSDPSSGRSKWSGRTSGAYSGPSSQLATDPW